ncbi:MAG TPA: hypothetical protein ENJ04_08730 [Nitrospirae bacterium]|nr:hypothetical protein [Nitrospirota bacterium]
MRPSDTHEAARWYVVYTKPAQEDIVEKHLHTANIEVLNPAVRKKRFYKGRLRMIVEKLFPCYVFARFDPERDYRLIKYTRGVRYVIGSRSGTPYTVDESIIESILSRMKDGFIDLSAKELKPGDRLVITDGPMSGFEGVFLCERPKDRVLILLREISCRLEIEKQAVSLTSR